jgi:hypothetical protein
MLLFPGRMQCSKWAIRRDAGRIVVDIIDPSVEGVSDSESAL